MSDRLTSDWTSNSEQAFGTTGKQGDLGEQLALDLLLSLRVTHRHNPDNHKKQIEGKDIEILHSKKWYGVDVKANIHSNGNSKVCIDLPKMKKSKATYWLHINTKDHLNDYIIYRVEDMLKYVEENQIPQVGVDRVCWVDKKIAKML